MDFLLYLFQHNNNGQIIWTKSWKMLIQLHLKLMITKIIYKDKQASLLWWERGNQLNIYTHLP